jgi:hypothetical protein
MSQDQNKPKTKTNEQHFDMIGEALVARLDYEKNLAIWESQRFADDRDEQNNDPFPNASNIRYPLADMIIEQKKAVYSQIIYSSEYLAVFKALTPANYPYANNLAPYYDQIVKEHTEFETQNIYCLDSGLQDGHSFMKISYEYDLGVPIFKWIENLMIIRPALATDIQVTPWITEVIHLTEDEAFAKFGKLPDFDKLWKLASDEDGNSETNDTLGRLRDRYLRRGINISTGSKRLVVWLHNYQDSEGGKRMRYLSPDDPRFDFGGAGALPNDREYPFVDADKKSRWMYEEFKREWTSKNQASSRGIPEIVQEYEFLLTALWRFKHNIMTFTQTPTFTTPSNQPPGSTNNYTFVPGGFLPSGAQPVAWPAPPISLDEEMLKTREIAERRLATPDTGVSRGNTMNDSRTAREVSLISSIQQMAVNYETTPWKKFIRGCLKQGWNRLVQFKPQSLGFYLNGTMQSLPPDAINGDYMIDLSWSGDNINKEFLGQKAQALHQAALQLGDQRVISETWKNLIQHFAPGQSQRFELNPQLEQQDMAERIGSEIDTMVSVGFPVRVKQDVDHYQAVVLTMQFIQAQQHKGTPLDQQAVNLLSQYMAGHRDMLAKTNPQARKQLDFQINQLEQADKMQQQQQALQQVALAKQQELQQAGMVPTLQIPQSQQPQLPQQ